jgi:septum formation protein
MCRSDLTAQSPHCKGASSEDQSPRPSLDIPVSPRAPRKRRSRGDSGRAPCRRGLGRCARAHGVSLPLRDEPFLAIAADQVLEFAGEAFGKAHSAEEAFDRLRRLSGRPHLLHSAYCLVYHDGQQNLVRILSSRVVTAEMTMRKLSDEELQAYLATDEWRGCAGCYQYENQGVHLFESVLGDASTIIGLPLLNLLEDMRRLGVNPLLQKQGPWTLYSL